MSNLLEKARQLLADGELCDHCLGRAFSQLGTGLRNRERGRALRVLLHMESASVRLISPSCRLCQGAFEQVPQWVERALRAVAGFEFQTYLMGTRALSEIEAAEAQLCQRFQLHGEPFKQEFNREVGRRFGTILAERGYPVAVDFHEPQIVLLMNLATGALERRIQSLFVYGRYRKLIRGIPQTRWPCRDCHGRGCERCRHTGKMYPESVEELISPPLLRVTEGTGTAFHGAGREDIDALMLGRGRPFVIEIKEPKRRSLDLSALEREINQNATGKVEVSPLQLVDAALVEHLKSWEAEKLYEARVRFAQPVSSAALSQVFQQLKETPIEQRTPQRVSHRRADLVRTRRVLSVTGELLTPIEALLKIHGEGGLYIKELISGDEGRTQPSLSALLRVSAEVTELNVLEVLADPGVLAGSAVKLQIQPRLRR